MVTLDSSFADLGDYSSATISQALTKENTSYLHYKCGLQTILFNSHDKRGSKIIHSRRCTQLLQEQKHRMDHKMA